MIMYLEKKNYDFNGIIIKSDNLTKKYRRITTPVIMLHWSIGVQGLSSDIARTMRVIVRHSRQLLLSLTRLLFSAIENIRRLYISQFVVLDFELFQMFRPLPEGVMQFALVRQLAG